MCANTIGFVKKIEKYAEMMEFWPIFEKWSMADYKNAVAMCTGLRRSAIILCVYMREKVRNYVR